MIGLADRVAILDFTPTREFPKGGAARRAVQPFDHAIPPKLRGLSSELAVRPRKIKRISGAWR